MASKKREKMVRAARAIASGGSIKETAKAGGTGVGVYWVQLWLARTFPSLFGMIGGWGMPLVQLFVAHKMAKRPRLRASAHALAGIAGFNAGAKLFGGQTTSGVEEYDVMGPGEDVEYVMLSEGDAGGLQGQNSRELLDVGGLQGQNAQTILDVGTYDDVGS